MAKRITAIVSLSIIGILILTTLILSCINIDYKIEYNKPNNIFVQYGSQLQQVKDQDSSQISKLIDDASKKNLLSQMFSGQLNQKQSLMTDSTNGITLKNPTKFYVSFIYNEPQILKLNGKDYKENGEKCYYTRLVFEVNDVDSFDDVTVFVTPDKDADGDPMSSTKYTRRYIYKANFKPLYDFLIGHNYNE